MAELRPDFYFTQTRLQDFLDCKRRFQLRYLLEQPWPAHVVEPPQAFEEHLEQGRLFHRLVHQYFLGLPADSLAKIASRPPLDRWWQDFLTFGVEGIPLESVPEVTIVTTLDGFRLMGKFDLITPASSGEISIIDWKTSKYIPSMSELRSRMQSRLYPFLLSKEGFERVGVPEITPDQISMRYWYTEEPESPLQFRYSQSQFEADKEFLSSLVHEIVSLQGDEFPRTNNIEMCRFCVYRSLCDRGAGAGTIGTLEDDLEDLQKWIEDADLDQVQEIEF